MMLPPPNYGDAILSLRPGALYILHEDDLDTIEWVQVEGTPPTPDEIRAELLVLESAYETNTYQRDRRAEYPPIEDYLDGIVKGDQAQIDAYIAACQAVKEKYPKPEAG